MSTNCGKNVGNKTIHDEMDIHSYEMSNHVVCVSVLGWRSQPNLFREETDKGAETYLSDDFIRFHQLFQAPLHVL